MISFISPIAVSAILPLNISNFFWVTMFGVNVKRYPSSAQGRRIKNYSLVKVSPKSSHPIQL